MPERIHLPPSPYSVSWLLYPFKHADKQRTVWLHKIGAGGELIHGHGYKWECTCGANSAGLAGPLTVQLLHAAWSHFDVHLDPQAVPVRGAPARWYRGGKEPDLDAVFELEVARILGHAPELPVEVVNICGECGNPFEISDSDPHWATGRGPICSKGQSPLTELKAEKQMENVNVILARQGFHRIGRVDDAGRRSLWLREEEAAIELRAGREGDDASVRIDKSHPLYEQLRDVMARARFAAEYEQPDGTALDASYDKDICPVSLHRRPT